jgi:uncharacterized protein
MIENINSNEPDFNYIRDFLALGIADPKNYGYDKIASLLQSCVDINSCLEEGDTFLILASSYGRFDVVKLLIESGANPNLLNEEGLSPLVAAASGGHTEIYNYLLPLTRLESQEGTQSLLSIGQITRSRWEHFDSNENLIHEFDKAACEGKVEVLKRMISEGFPVNAVRPSGGTILGESIFVSIYSGNSVIINSLLSAGANPNLGFLDQKVTPLLNATEYTSEKKYRKMCREICEQLIATGASINERNNIGETALIIAAKNGDNDLVKVLIRSGANTSIKDNKGFTALDYAKKRKHQQIVAFLEMQHH